MRASTRRGLGHVFEEEDRRLVAGPSPRRVRRGLALGAFAATALLWSGCEAKKQTEFVAGVSTQVVVPRDLKSIRLDVSVGGVVQFCRGYKVYDGKVQLPRSLGALPASGKAGENAVTVTVTGFTEDFSEGSGLSVFSDCVSVSPKVGEQGARILRRSRQPYAPDRIVFLPMPLKYSCFDHKDCEAEDKTCKAGRCVDASIDPSRLPDYTDELLNGTGGACFRASECMQGLVPAVVVNANDCTYAVPNSPSSPPVVEGAPPNPFPKGGDGVNVEIVYDGGLNKEILDKDDQEGFTIPDPAKPQQFRLAPGLCDMVKGSIPAANPADPPVDLEHRITGVRVASICQPKTPFQPLCAADQLVAMDVAPEGISGNSNPPSACKPRELKAAKSVLMIITDDTQNHRIFYNGADRAAVGLVLDDPAFTRTQVGLSFYPGGAGTCGGLTPAVPPELAATAQKKIVDKLAERDPESGNAAPLQPLNTPTTMDGALKATYDLLKGPQFAGFNRRAVLLIGNREFGATSCSAQTPLQLVQGAKTDRIDTYVGMFARQESEDLENLPPQPIADQMATAGSPLPALPRAFDARKEKAEGQNAFRRILDDLATCVYDVDTVPENSDVLAYSDPIAVTPPQESVYKITRDANCTTEASAAAANGWGVDASDPAQRRVRVCGQACDNYREILKKAAAYGLQYNQKAIAVPIFSHKAGCAPK
ncbi:MAG: hypothetical protein KF819_02760 [Labilithrix sp.]|nr:hypothetical protein [Labilithrix sp.]